MKTLGIDLGTTNTVAATNSTVIRMGNAAILPSVVSFLPSGELLVGDAAKKRRAIDPRNTVSSAKRIIGRHYRDYETQRYLETCAVPLEKTEEGAVVFATRAGFLSPEDIGATVARELVRLGDIPADKTSVVVGVPAAFGDWQREATLRAVLGAGFKEVRLLEEPVATAIAYLARSSLKYAVVYDLGGGTFDLAIVDCSRYPFRVVAHGGDAYLGGDDVDRAIARYAADKVLRASGWDLKSDPVVFDRLLVEAERAKLRLATDEATSIDLAEVDEAAPTQIASLALSRQMLSELTAEMIKKTFGICDQVMGEAGIRTREIDAVFLAGGTTALPGLRDMVKEYFGKRPRHDLDPMHVVAVGTSLAAARPDLAQLLEAYR